MFWVLLPVLLLVTALIVYGSLYPWQFHQTALAASPPVVLLHSWPLVFDRFIFKDVGVNVVLYLPFGAACYLWLALGLARRAVWLRVGAPIVLALALSSSMEMIQLFDARRICSMVDVILNVTGSALGVVAGSQYRRSAHTGVSIGPRAAAPLFLISCWILALLFPLMPDLSTHHLLGKLAAFTSPPFSPIAFFNVLVAWMIAARLLEAASWRTWFPLLLLALPLRLFVSGITLPWTDCLAALLAWAIWSMGLVRRDAVLAGLSLAAIIASGLSPFHFSPVSQGFSWVPFRALLNTDWESGFAVFFRKCFVYGSTIWLLAEAGLSMLSAATGVAAILAGIEAVQLYLPEHVAESTDPLNAMIMAWILTRLPRNEKPAKGVC